MHRGMNAELVGRPRLRLRVSQYEKRACYYRTGGCFENSDYVPFDLPGRRVGSFVESFAER